MSHSDPTEGEVPGSRQGQEDDVQGASGQQHPEQEEHEGRTTEAQVRQLRGTTCQPQAMTDETAGDQPSDPRLVSPDGKPWCTFVSGSLYCINDPCLNPKHRSAIADDLE